MKLSTRARYGTRALVDLAQYTGKEPVQLKDIARRQNISLHYLEHLIAPLIGAGIISSTRGARGGLRLARQPGDIKLSEVVQLLEGSVAPVQCIGDPESCPRSEVCVTRDVWDRVRQAMDDTLSAITLQELVEKQQKQEAPPTRR